MTNNDCDHQPFTAGSNDLVMIVCKVCGSRWDHNNVPPEMRQAVLDSKATPDNIRRLLTRPES